MDLSQLFTTKGQAMDFSARLAQLSEMIYKTDFNLDNSLLQIFGIQKKDSVLALFRDNNVPLDSPSALKDFITKVQATITQLPVFFLTIAFEPDQSTLKAISDWFVINVKKQMIFDFTIDRSIVAGATINYNGTFKDYSLKIPVMTSLQKIIQKQFHPEQSQQQANIQAQTNLSAESMTMGR